MRRLAFVAVVVALHAAAFLTITVTTAARQQREDTTLFKLVDAAELPPPPPPEPPPPPPEDPPEVAPQPEVAEEIVETDEPVVEVPEPAPQPVVMERQAEEITYLAQHLVSVAPLIAVEEIRERIEYPPLARRQGIEGVVFLELYIDADGRIRRIEVLRDPGYGLGDAAVAAFEGMRATPARANGEAVAVRFRYPVRFTVN